MKQQKYASYMGSLRKIVRKNKEGVKMQVQYRFTDTELKTLFKENLTILVDTREQQNQHILNYFDKKKVKYLVKKLDAGDYSLKLTSNTDLGIARDLYFPVMIEKKNSVDELASSFKDRTRFESEFIRASGSGTKIYLLIEDENGYQNILKGNYRSEYAPKALLASLKAFEARYNITTAFIPKQCSGNFIYYTLRYYLYEYLKN